MACSVGRKSISASKRNLTSCVTSWHDGSYWTREFVTKNCKNLLQSDQIDYFPTMPSHLYTFSMRAPPASLRSLYWLSGSLFCGPFVTVGEDTPPVLWSFTSLSEMSCIWPLYCTKSAVSLSASQRPFSQLAWTQCRVLDMCRFSGLSHGYCFL